MEQDLSNITESSIFVNSISKVTIPLIYKLQNNEISDVEYEVQTLIMTTNDIITSKKKQGKQYKMRKGYIRINDIIKQYKTTQYKQQENLGGINNWYRYKYIKTEILKIYYNLKDISIQIGDHQLPDIVIILQGSDYVKGTYVDQRFISVFLCYFCPQFQEQQQQNILQQQKYITQLELYNNQLLQANVQLNNNMKEVQTELQQKIQREQEFQDKLQEYQYIQFIDFNELQVKVYGDLQDPLFRCSDILIDVLGYAESNKNRFYQDNKKNAKYIATLSNCEGTKPQKYFTELGLYRCLFSSGKSVAIEFQEKVAQLLKDIRLGNLQLLVNKECDFTQQIQMKNNEIIQYITMKSNIEKQLQELKEQLESVEEELQDRQQLLDKCKKTCSLYKQKVKENGKVVQEYGGSAFDPERRDRQHRSCSSNRGLRQAIKEGKEVEYELISTFTYYTESERRQKERELILGIPQSIRLNKVIPRI